MNATLAPLQVGDLPVEHARTLASQDPITAVLAGFLLLVGGTLIMASSGVFGALSFGAVAELFIPSMSQAPAQREE
jgi:hypothetical protein